MCEIGWYTQVVEHDGTQVMVTVTWKDEMSTCDNDQVLQLEKKKEKNKTL